MTRRHATWIPRSATPVLRFSLRNWRFLFEASYAVAYVPANTFRSRWHRPRRDDGRGRDLCFHTLPLGSRMLGLRPISKTNSARAVRAHFPTARGISLPQACTLGVITLIFYSIPLHKSMGSENFQKLQNRGRDATRRVRRGVFYLTQRRRERRGGVWEQSTASPIVLSGSGFPTFYWRWPGEPRRVTPSPASVRTRG